MTGNKSHLLNTYYVQRALCNILIESSQSLCVINVIMPIFRDEKTVARMWFSSSFPMIIGRAGIWTKAAWLHHLFSSSPSDCRLTLINQKCIRKEIHFPAKTHLKNKIRFYFLKGRCSLAPSVQSQEVHGWTSSVSRVTKSKVEKERRQIMQIGEIDHMEDKLWPLSV